MNPARKMSRVFNRLPEQNNQASELAWAKLFLGRAMEDSVDDAHFIASRLYRLNSQADDLERALRTRSVPPELFESQIKRLRRAILPTRMKEQWSTIRREIGSDIPLMLLWAAHVMGGPDYDELSDEIQDLIEKLNEAEALLDKNVLPEPLCSLFRQHLNEMKRAAASIGSEGSEPFKQSVASLHFDLSISEDVREVIRDATPEQQKILDKIKQAFQKSGVVLGKILGKAGNANQALQLVDRVSSMLERTPPS